MEDLSLYIILLGFMVFAFIGIPFVSIKKVKIKFDQSDNEFVKKLRRKRPDIDMRFALYTGLKNVNDDMLDFKTNREFYYKVATYSNALKQVTARTLFAMDSYIALSKYINKSSVWWIWKYYRAGKDRSKVMKELLKKHIDNFLYFKEMMDDLKKIREDYEKESVAKKDSEDKEIC